MREHFPWARELSTEEFERALLLVGLLSPSMARRQRLPGTDELSSLLLQQWKELQGHPWPWRLRKGTQQLIQEQGEALRLIAAAKELLHETRDDWHSPGRGLRVEVNAPGALDPHTLCQALGRAGANSVYVRRKAEGELAWSWPLRIGLGRSSKLLARVTSERSLRPLFQEFHYESAPMQANLLLFEASLAEVTETLGHSRRRPTTDAVVIFGGVGDTGTSVWRMLSLLSKLTGAQGVFVFDALDAGGAQAAAEGVIAHLSHDQPLDCAVAREASWHWHGTLRVSVLAWATRSLVEATSVREQGRILAQRLKQMGGAQIHLDSSTAAELGVGTPSRAMRGPPSFGVERGKASATSVSACELGADLEKRLLPAQPPLPTKGLERGTPPPKSLPFERESEGASTVAALAKATAAEVDADAARREARYLQARVETPERKAVKGKAPLLRSQDYSACVFIGARKRTWLGLRRRFEAPQPPEGGPLLLDVLFWEPTVSPKPQIKRLRLQAQGDSQVVRFAFRTAPDQSVFSARIAVYHRNRNLQTGLLRGRVGDGPAALTFTLDAAPVPKFIGLADRAGVGASIIVNEDPRGAMQAFVYRDGKAADVEVSEADRAELTAVFGSALTDITRSPKEYSDLAREGSRTLLRDLAQHGSRLLTHLRKHTLMGESFDQADRIQIVMAHVGPILPIEFFYEGKAPKEDAVVCRGPQGDASALASGACRDACTEDTRSTICPLRFWSLSKVIERHAHLPEHTRLSADYQFRTGAISARSRLLDPLRSAVVGASKEADTAVPDTVKNLCAGLDAVLQHPVHLATDWASWEKEVESVCPTLLVLLPHHLREGRSDKLEIGGDKLKSTLIGEEHVRSSSDPGALPIVLLIGCETSAAKVNLEGFVPIFQDAGAAIIVSTIAAILGRHAGPAAAAIAQEMKKQEGNPDATFGDVMLTARRRLLSEGIPMVLALTSYGDADCRIGAANKDR